MIILKDKIFNFLGYISIKEYNRKLEETTLKLKTEHEEELRKERLPKYVKGRRRGNSTRYADWYIQELFKENKISILDHYGTRNASEFLMHIIINRLTREHQHEKFKFDKKKLAIERLKNKYDK